MLGKINRLLSSVSDKNMFLSPKLYVHVFLLFNPKIVILCQKNAFTRVKYRQICTTVWRIMIVIVVVPDSRGSRLKTGLTSVALWTGKFCVTMSFDSSPQSQNIFAQFSMQCTLTECIWRCRRQRLWSRPLA